MKIKKNKIDTTRNSDIEYDTINANKISKRLNYNSGVKYLLNRNENSFSLNKKLKNKIGEKIQVFNTIDCIDNFNEERATIENELFISSVLNRLKEEKGNFIETEYGSSFNIKNKNKLKLFMPIKMNDLRSQVELQMVEPYLYLNKNLRKDNILNENSILSEIFEKNVRRIPQILEKKYLK